MNQKINESGDEARVRNLIESWASAVSSGDRAAIIAHHSRQMLMFDFVSIVRGIEAYDRTWDFFFASPKGPISFIPSELIVTTRGEAAFASCLIHCDGTSGGALDLRLTVGLHKIAGEWIVMHEHHSVPTKEERFIGPSDASTSEGGA